jgi:hypothetical protein
LRRILIVDGVVHPGVEAGDGVREVEGRSEVVGVRAGIGRGPQRVAEVLRVLHTVYMGVVVMWKRTRGHGRVQMETKFPVLLDVQPRLDLPQLSRIIPYMY